MAIPDFGLGVRGRWFDQVLCHSHGSELRVVQVTQTLARTIFFMSAWLCVALAALLLCKRVFYIDGLNLRSVPVQRCMQPRTVFKPVLGHGRELEAQNPYEKTHNSAMTGLPTSAPSLQTAQKKDEFHVLSGPCLMIQGQRLALGFRGFVTLETPFYG